MKKQTKRFIAMMLSLAMVVTTPSIMPESFATNVLADTQVEGSHVTSFNYDFAYTTPGYADGTLSITATEDGIYKAFWGDASGNKLTKNGYDYTYLARIVVQDGKGSFNLENDYLAIPEGAATVLVYKRDSLEYVYDIPNDKKFVASANSYTFGSISDPHYTRYNSGVSADNDDAIPAMAKAMNFLDNAGIEFVAMSGDLTQAGEQLALDRFNAELAKHPNMTVVTAIGNHDSRTTVSTSNNTILDTSIMRWENSITSSYFTVDEDGTINSKLDAKYPILATDALINPIETQYREVAGGEIKTKDVRGLDFVVEAGGNIFIIFNDIAKTGETYDTDKLLTTGQMDWLEEQLETYKDRRVFLYQHYYLAVNTLNNDSVDYNNCTGDLKNKGGYSYDLDFRDVIKTTSGKNLQALLTQYSNATIVTGHSHWQYSMQNLNNNINFGRLGNGNGGTMIHLSSVTEPRYIADEDPGRTSLNGYASEGATVTTYDDCTVYNNIDFYNEQYEAYATYIAPAGNNSQYEPIKNSLYKESTTAITGDQYLDYEDMTTLQLLKSDYNLTVGAGYVYSSKGGENTDTALTDGKSTGGYYCSKGGAKEDQYVKITLDGEQDVANINYMMIYFVNGLTDSSSLNIQISDDDETYETIGSYTNKTYKDIVYEPDLTNVTLTKYKYIKLNLTGGVRDYGYQVREFAVIGYERNQTPNTAGSESSIDGEAPIDYTSFLATDYNLVYTADYTQSTTGSENKAGALTDGSLNGFLNTERKSGETNQTVIIDLGKGNKQDVSNIDYVLLYSQNAATLVTAFDVSVSEDGVNYEGIGSYDEIDLDTNHFAVDTSDVTISKFRYVKLHLSDGKTNYGYQVKEFAVIGKQPIVYPEVPAQATIVSDSTKNIALNKTVYVSTTATNEGKDPTVLTDGSKSKYWSSLWDNKLTSDYVVVDLGKDYDATTIGYGLVNYKSNNTFCDDMRLMFSETFDPEDPDAGFYEVGKVKASSWENLLKFADADGYAKAQVIDPEPGNVRYVKFFFNGHKNYGFQVNEVAVILKGKTLADATITLEGDSFEYTGSEIKPAVTVVYDGETLNGVDDKDYKVTYSNNIAVGTATVTIVGNGDFAGTITKTFEITKKEMDEDGFSVDISFDENNMPVFDVKLDGLKLVEGTDYTKEITENADGSITVTFTGAGTSFEGEFVHTVPATDLMAANPAVNVTSDNLNQITVTITNPSTYGAVAQTYDVYVGTTKVATDVKAGTYSYNKQNAGANAVKVIAKLGKTATEGITANVNVTGPDAASFAYTVGDVVYSGSFTKPELTVKYNGTTLVEDVDYTVTCGEDTAVGKANFTVTGIGLYQGTYQGTFNIKAFDFNKDAGLNVNCEAAYAYTGKAVKPVTLTYGEYTLVEGTDYTITYNNNKNVGTATYEITGIGSYSGTLTGSFAINPANLNDVDIDETNIDKVFEYTAKAITPEVSLSIGGTVLEKDVDYTVAYADNTNPGTAVITIAAKSANYTGTVTKTFVIAKKEIKSNVISATIDEEENITVTITNGESGVELIENVDYEVNVEKTEEGKIVVTVTGIGTGYVGTYTKVFTANGDDDTDYSGYISSEYNMLYTIPYTQSSAGAENKEGILTDGSLTTGFMNTERKESAKEQEIVFDLGRRNKQNVSNINYLLLYSQNDLTLVSAFDVSISADGENYENIGAYSGVTLNNSHFYVDVSRVTFEKFRYVKLHITNGKTDYGYQVREFAIIGKEAKPIEVVEDQSAIVADPEKNVALNKEVFVSSTATAEGTDATVLTDGSLTGYWSSLWDNTRTFDYVIVDLGADYDATQIGYGLVKYKAENTSCSDMTIQFSETYNEANPSAGFVDVANTKGAWSTLQKAADPNGYIKTSITDVAPGKVRYIKFVFNGHMPYGFQVNEVAVVLKEKAITDATITLASNEYEYLGTEVKPSVNVVYDGKVLNGDEDTDYLLTYENNIEIGTATVTITGNGEYYGSVTKTFDIIKKTMSEDEFSVDVTFDENKMPVFVVNLGDYTLTEGVDYTKAITENADGSLNVAFTAKGEHFAGSFSYTVPATDLPATDGTVAVTNSAVNEISVAITKPTTYGAASQVYDVYVDDELVGENVSEGTHKFGNNTVGEHTVKVVAKLGESATEGVTREVSVVGVDAKDFTCTLDATAYPYQGVRIEPELTVKYAGKTLEKDVDYTVAFDDNLDVGVAFYTVSGIGLYQGTNLGSFAIKKFDVSVDKGLTIDAKDSEYTSLEVKPIRVIHGEKTLIEGTDYTITYSNNVNAGTASYVIKGIGSYSGETSGNFEIAPTSMNNISVDASNLNKVFEYNTYARTPILSLTINGTKLEPEQDYHVEYTDNTNPGTATITVTPLNDNFIGKITKTFTIKKKDITVTNISATLNSDNATVTVKVTNNENGVILVEGTDYRVTTVKNADGNILLAITGIGVGYTGEYTKTFVVEKPTTVAPTKAEVEKPGKVTLKKPKNVAKKSVKLTWKKLTNVVGYQVRYSLKKSMKPAKKKLVKKNVAKLTIKKLKLKKKYFIQIRAYVLDGSKKVYGDWSSKKKIVIKK